MHVYFNLHDSTNVFVETLLFSITVKTRNCRNMQHDDVCVFTYRCPFELCFSIFYVVVVDLCVDHHASGVSKV